MYHYMDIFFLNVLKDKESNKVIDMNQFFFYSGILVQIVLFSIPTFVIRTVISKWKSLNDYTILYGFKRCTLVDMCVHFQFNIFYKICATDDHKNVLGDIKPKPNELHSELKICAKLFFLMFCITWINKQNK